MSAVVQQQPSYTQPARLYALTAAISFLGLGPFIVEIASYPVHILWTAVVVQGIFLAFFKSVFQRDFIGSLLVAMSVFVFATPTAAALWPQAVAPFLFALTVLPAALFSEVGSGIRQVLASAAELRREMRRVTWPTMQETLKFVGIVSVFVVVAALFWAFIDRIIQSMFSVLFYYLT